MYMLQLIKFGMLALGYNYACGFVHFSGTKVLIPCDLLKMLHYLMHFSLIAMTYLKWPFQLWLHMFYLIFLKHFFCLNTYSIAWWPASWATACFLYVHLFYLFITYANLNYEWKKIFQPVCHQFLVCILKISKLFSKSSIYLTFNVPRSCSVLNLVMLAANSENMLPNIGCFILNFVMQKQIYRCIASLLIT